MEPSEVSLQAVKATSHLSLGIPALHSSMFLDRFHCALYAFDQATHRWASIPLRNPHGPITQKMPSSRPPDAIGNQRLSLASWNIHASRSDGIARSKHILDHILQGPKFPDIIHLQEVTDDVRQSLLHDPRVRSGFLTTDAEDHGNSFMGRPFATMTLLSSTRFGSPLLAEEGERGGKLMLDDVFRMELPCRYKRDALCVDIAAPAAPGAVLRLLNVHLDPLDSLYRRYLQIRQLAGLLHEPRSSGGIIAGDFDATLPEGHRLINEHELLDGWVALQGITSSDGVISGSVFGGLKAGLKAGRLEKIAMLNLKPDELVIEILQPCFIGANRSDDLGLRCTFTI